MSHILFNGSLCYTALCTSSVKSGAQVIEFMSRQNGVELVAYLLQACKGEFIAFFYISCKHRRYGYFFSSTLPFLRLEFLATINPSSMYAVLYSLGLRPVYKPIAVIS